MLYKYVEGMLTISFFAFVDSRLAHFLSHMLFNGLKSYDADDLVETMQRLGIQFGSHLNAHSSFDETVFKLAPRDNSVKTLDICFTVLRDWMDGALLSEEEIEKERGVILSELQYRDSVRSRLNQQLYRFLFPNSLVSTRSSTEKEMATTEVVTREEFVEFYRQYYTPNRITYIVVGDVDPDEIETMIAEKFADATNPNDPGLDGDVGSVESGTGFYTAVFTDEEFLYNELYLFQSRDYVSKPDSAEKRTDDLSLALANNILKRRLQVLTLEADTPISFGNAGRSIYGHAVERPYITVDHIEGRLEEGIMVLEQEFRRFMEYGIVQSELDEAKANVLNGYEENVERADTRTSSGVADQLSQSINDRRVLSTPEQDLQIILNALDELTLERVHGDFVEYWNTTDISLVYMTNRATDPDLLEQLLRVHYEESQMIPVEPPIDTSDITFGYTDFGPAGTIVSDTMVEDLKIRQLVLSNNVRINMKTTEFDDNQIFLKVRLGSGRLSQPVDMVGLDDFASVMINHGGLGLHSDDELRRLTAGKTVDLNFSVENDYFSFDGSTNPDDVELMLQLLTAHITDPGYREEAVRLFRHNVPPHIDHLEHSLRGPFDEALHFVRGQDDRFGVPTEAGLLSFEVDDAKSWMESDFLNGYLELSIVGEIPDSILDYILNTVGALPTRNEEPNREDRGADLVFPSTPQSLSLTYDSDIDQAAVLSFWEIPSLEDGNDIFVMRQMWLLSFIFEDRIRIQIREELGAAFSYGASAYSEEGLEYGEFHAYAIVAPDNTTLVLNHIHQIANDLVREGITDDELARATAPHYENLENTLVSNSYWLNSVMDGCQSNPYYLDWSRNRDGFYETVTVEDINELAANYLPLNKAVSVDILPLDIDGQVGNRQLLSHHTTKNVVIEPIICPDPSCSRSIIPSY